MHKDRTPSNERFSAYLKEAIDEYPDMLDILHKEPCRAPSRARHKQIAIALLLFLLLTAVFGPVFLQAIRPEESEAGREELRMVQKTRQSDWDPTYQQYAPGGKRQDGDSPANDAEHSSFGNLDPETVEEIKKACIGIRIPDAPEGFEFVVLNVRNDNTDTWQATFVYNDGTYIWEQKQDGKTELYYKKMYQN